MRTYNGRFAVLELIVKYLGALVPLFERNFRLQILGEFTDEAVLVFFTVEASAVFVITALVMGRPSLGTYCNIIGVCELITAADALNILISHYFLL